MIGLEHICNLYNMQFKDLAEKLEVSKQIISIWIKGTRPIAKTHLPKLEKIFNIPEKYFSKELTELDKLEIQMYKLDNEWIEEEYEVPLFNSATGEDETDENGKVIMVKETYTDRGQQMYRERLEYKIDEVKTINRLKQTLEKQFYMGEKNEEMDGGLSEAYSILNLYELFINIIEKGGVSRNTLRNVLIGIANYQKKDFNKNNNDLAIKITDVIKEEEDRLRKEAEYWLEMSKGMDDLFK